MSHPVDFWRTPVEEHKQHHAETLATCSPMLPVGTPSMSWRRHQENRQLATV